MKLRIHSKFQRLYRQLTSDLWEPWHSQNWAGASTHTNFHVRARSAACFCTVMVWTTQEPRVDDNMDQDADVVT